jgi:hypothetical protein
MAIFLNRPLRLYYPFREKRARLFIARKVKNDIFFRTDWLRAPLKRPLSIRDCSVFLEHLNTLKDNPEFTKAFKEMMPHYRTSTTDVVGHDDPII